MTDRDLDELRAELADFALPKKEAARSPREERIIAGFEDIQRFVDEHGRPPRHGAELDIFERLYAVRLDRMREVEESRLLLMPLDRQDLLLSDGDAAFDAVEVTDVDDLWEALRSDSADSDLTELRHVQSTEERRAAEEIANRRKCEDFEQFERLFAKVQEELQAGLRKTRPFELKAEIRTGGFFIIGGQKAYVADVGEIYVNAQRRTEARLRVIFDNGTESNLLLRSLQRALNKDEAGRRITDPEAGPLFSDERADDDQESGTIYVLRSLSDDPMVTKYPDSVHKIGVTNMSVEQRIGGARLQPTFLMADVEVVATYKLFNINRTKLENLLHRVLSPARLDLEIMDRFGNLVKPREWFLAPLSAIDEVVRRILDGTISDYRYKTETARLEKIN